MDTTDHIKTEPANENEVIATRVPRMYNLLTDWRNCRALANPPV